MNYQSWTGCLDPKFGYGSMLDGFVSNAPKTVTFDPKASVNVYMSVPHTAGGWWDGQHRVLFTMWETDQLPKTFTRWLSQYDQVLVPCNHNVELFSQHHNNVSYVPLGVDRTFWKPHPQTRTGPFRFHAGGSLWMRKGLDIVVRAFNNLRLPDAELHIKAAPHAKDTPTRNLGANIVMHRNWMSLDMQRTWFLEGDVFIAASRGEGFGLMPLQAISLGIPTIVSTTTGQEQFAHLATGVVSCRKSAAETVGQWDEPNQDELEQLMMDHYRNWADRKEQAVVNAKLADQFSWKKAVNKLVAAIPTGTALSTDTWVKPNVVVPVTLHRNLNCDIGKNSYTFRKGVTYEVPENVYLVLKDARMLV